MIANGHNTATRTDPTIRTTSDLDSAIAAAGLRARTDGQRRRIPCPAPGHPGDRSGSNCAVWVGSDDSVGAVCHSQGCSYEDILRGLGVFSGGVKRQGSRPDTARPRIVATYDYRDRRGGLFFQVVRFAPKDFRQRRPDGAGGWTWSTKGVERVLYRLPELLAADPDETVFVCEGEKDADNLAALGLVATTAPGGAGKWRHVPDLSALAGRRVVALPDNDSAQQGLRHCEDVAASLATVASSVKVLSLPGLAPTGEVGYDADSGIYVSMSGLGRTSATMPLAEAVALLKDALADFPFVDAASEAHAVAMIVQPFVRPLIDGPTPLYLIDAPTRGTGKTLLANLACLLSDGSAARTMAIPRSDEELEKRITALLMAGHGAVLIDNIDRKLEGGSMAAALTTTSWRGRVLGKSEMLDIPNNATWLATGNNVDVSDEVARRIALIRLDSGVERPEERDGFRHPDLLGWAKERRDKIVSSVLSVVRHWLDEGASRGRTVLGGFESWTAVMGGILDAADIDGFLGNCDYLYAVADLESREWEALCAAWHAAYSSHPVRATEALDVAKENDLLMPLWNARNARGAQTSFGKALRARRDRVFGEYRIRFVGIDPATKASMYTLDEVRAACEPAYREQKTAGREQVP